MEEPINKRLFEKYLKDESGLKDSTTDWEMSQSSVSDIILKNIFVGKKNLRSQKVISQVYESESALKVSFSDNIIFRNAELFFFQSHIV